MDHTELQADGRTLVCWGDPGAADVILQPVDEHDAALMASEAEKLRRLRGSEDWCLVAVPVERWNEELAPWESPPVFGREGFGSGAAETLAFLRENVLPRLDRAGPAEGRRFHLAGYSLAGLFALWCACRTDTFSGIAAVSPSVWYPGWTNYARAHPVLARRVYLSLGLREERTRNRVMSTVGDAIREQHRLLTGAGVDCALEWNEGNHFMDSDGRTARGLAWLLR